MIETFTKNEVRFLYGETTQNENKKIEERLIKEDAFFDELSAMKNIVNQMDELTMKAPDRVVDKILNYSKGSLSLA
ncbi:MAG: hypothetical protein JXQ90_13285 [Cyclobacteriaceae bacterium]